MYFSGLNHRYCTMRILLLTLLFTQFAFLYGQGSELDSVLNRLREVEVPLTENSGDTIQKLWVNEMWVSALVSDGDTLYIADLGNVNISSPRTFESREDYLKYLRYRRYAAKVYPFAKEAIRIFKEAEYATENLKKRKRKKYLRKLSKELQKEFQDPLKRLSKTQGKILVKMIERELDARMFDLIKNTQGKLKAFYWNQSSKLYGYRLKTGYIEGDNPILDVVLQDFDISYDKEK